VGAAVVAGAAGSEGFESGLACSAPSPDPPQAASEIRARAAARFLIILLSSNSKMRSNA
jgi:hypothetical protein